MAIPWEQGGDLAVVVKPTSMAKEKQLEAIKRSVSCIDQCLSDGDLDYERLCRVCGLLWATVSGSFLYSPLGSVLPNPIKIVRLFKMSSTVDQTGDGSAVWF